MSLRTKRPAIAVVSVFLLLFGLSAALTQDASYQTKIYTKQGGDEMEIISGGTLRVYSGGTVDLDDAIGILTLAAGEINSADILDASIVSADIATDTIAAGDIAAGAVGTSELADGGVGAADLSATLKTGFIPLDLGSAREISSDDIGNLAAHGGLLATDSTPTYERINGATDKGLRVLWAATNVDAIQFAPVPIPPDLDEASDVTVHFYAEMGGATDTPTLTVAFFANVGDTDAGGATGALADAVGEVSVTIGNADIPAHPGFFNIEVTPGAHGTDTVDLYSAWVEYTRK